jgi:hypothetical protein
LGSKGTKRIQKYMDNIIVKHISFDRTFLMNTMKSIFNNWKSIYGINDDNENVTRKRSMIKAIKIADFWKNYNLMCDIYDGFG